MRPGALENVRTLLFEHTAPQRRVDISGQEAAVHLHLKDRRHSFEGGGVKVLATEDRWAERGVKEGQNSHP